MESSSALINLHTPRHWPKWLVYGLFRVIGLLPWPWMMAIGRAMGRLFMRFGKRRVRIAGINIALCYPELEEARREAMVRAHFESMGMGIMDLCFGWWASERQVLKRLRLHGEEHLRAAHARGKGVIVLSLHFTSVEFGIRVVPRIVPAYATYRPHQDPFIDHMMSHHRRLYTKGILARDDVRGMIRALRKGDCVWFAPDQNFGHKGFVFSTFFGIPAATNTATTRLAGMTGALVVPYVTARNLDEGTYDAHFLPPLEDFPSGDVQADTDRINLIYEQLIRIAPEQYFWSHRKFLDRPEGEQALY